MKKKNISKKVLAVLLSVVMLVSTIPFAIMSSAAGGSYDPAPYFSVAAQTEGARAWLDEEGNIQVTFPSASLGPSFAEYKTEIADGEITEEEKAARDDIPIAFYILELVDMGANNATHTEVVLDTIKVTGNEGTFPAADIGTIDLENNRYSVTITAVDSENWFSQPIYTTVTDVPVAEVDGSRFVSFSTSATAVREMATFDGETSSDNTAIATGNALLYMGTAEEAGTEDLSDNVGDTSALRFIMNTQPSGTQTFTTSYSRETWDFKGAEEVWYWLDFSRVSIEGMAFSVGAQCKTITGWADGETVDVVEDEVVQYSTKGTAASTYTGEAPYVYVQREDGGWDKVMMTNGTIDLANFKGYVRVPVEFLCSIEDRYITATNTGFGTDKSDIVASSPWAWANTDDLTAETQAAGDTYTATLKSSSQILVDPAGTPVSEALMLQYRVFKSSAYKRVGIASGTLTWSLGYMPAAAVGSNDDDALYTAATDSKRAVVDLSAGTVTRDDDTYRAIEDLKTMGFSFENCTSDSLQNSFFVDNIFFYRTDGKEYSPNSLNDETDNVGSPMSTYYSEENTIAKIIFDEIDKYITDPDWADYRELEYILDLIQAYVDAFKNAVDAEGNPTPKDTTFLAADETASYDATTGEPKNLAAIAETIGRAETWARAWQAWKACQAEGTIASDGSFPSNAGKNELVPLIVNTMEKLPAPEAITSVSDVLRAEIVKLWQAYSLLNLGQLEMLGTDEEEKLLKYFLLVENLDELDGDEFIVGQRLADNPFIVFNDFENNYALGDEGWRLEDNKNAYSTGFTSADGVVAGTGDLANDWRHLKNLVTYTTNGDTNITNYKDYGYSTTDADSTQEVMDGKLNYNASWATVTNNGYLNSTGITLYSDSSFTVASTDDPQKGVYHTITVTKDGAPLNIDDGDTDYYDNNMSSVNLGELAQEYTLQDTDTRIPLSIVFYVDFSELENFYFTINLYTREADGTHAKARVNMGDATLGGEDYKIENWKYFILDPTTGEWVKTHSSKQYCFNSSQNTSWGDTLGLDGYKGYIMVPLYHIKKVEGETAGIVTSETMMDQNSTYLNNIFAVQFCIAGENNTSLDEKSFSFDNIGFTYSDFYTAYSTRSDDSYAEIFGAKSLPASKFEEMVDAIDIYDDTTTTTNASGATVLKRDNDIALALAAYTALPTYQQGVVAEAYATLIKYENIRTGNAILDMDGDGVADEPVYTPAQLNDLIAALPDAAKTAQVSGESADGTTDYDLIYPGFKNGEVNYSTYGLDAETAATIIEYYTKSYKYYSDAEKADLEDSTSFMNAYKAAMRTATSLESIKTEAGSYGSAAAGTSGSGFLGELSTGLYTRKYDADGNLVGNFVSIAGRADVETFKETKYDILQYYTKATIEDGRYSSNVMNISRGFTYFLNNSQTFSIDGETIDGGIINFKNKMQTTYDDAAKKIEADERFSDVELQAIKDLLEEYNAFLAAYYSVEELYDLEQNILALFADATIGVFDAATDGSEITQVVLSNDNGDTTSATAYVDLTYIAALLEKTVTLEISSDLVLQQLDGTPYADFNSFAVEGLTANTPVTYTYDNLYPEEIFTRIPLNISVDATEAAKVPQGAVYEGIININVYDTDDINAGLTGDELVPIATLPFTVQFQSTNGTVPVVYVVEIPADMTIEWDQPTAENVSYTIKSATLNKGTLTVGVTDNTGNFDTATNTGKLVNGDNVLAYTASNFVDVTFSEDITTDTQPNPAPEIKIEQDDWDAAAIGEYRTTLTYTVVYDDGSDDSTT